MGRGLSDMQKKILRHAASRRGGAPWFTGSDKTIGQPAVCAALGIPWGAWSDSDIASVARSLKRLEGRGLVKRLRRRTKERTTAVALTPKGRDYLHKLDQAIEPPIA